LPLPHFHPAIMKNPIFLPYLEVSRTSKLLVFGVSGSLRPESKHSYMPIEMKIKLILLALLCSYGVCSGQSNKVTDIDGNEYPTVVVGEQKWMAENLRVTRYNNGDSILTGLNDDEWANTATGAYAVSPYSYLDGLDSEAEVVDAYGLLYNWYVVGDERGICPPGFRIPGESDFVELKDYLIDKHGLHNDPESSDLNGVGNALKSCRQIDSPLGGDCATSTHPRWAAHDVHYGKDLAGLSLLPSLERFPRGEFNSYGNNGYLWSSTKTSPGNAVRLSMYNRQGNVTLWENPTTYGFGLRCIRNSPPGVKTKNIIDPQYTSAMGRGDVLHDGGASITARGLVWSTHKYPDLEDHEGLVTVEGAVGAFSSEMVGLVSETTYYVRAYATNDMGTSYGEPYEFFTEPMIVFSQDKHQLVDSSGVMETRYFKVGPLGWTSAAIMEEHEGGYYPGPDDYFPPGFFSIVPDNIARGDFNGNGLEDFVMQWSIFNHTLPRESRAPISIFLNNGDGSFRMAPELIQGIGPLRFGPYRIKTADFNQNGRPDIVAASGGMIKRNPDGTATAENEPIPLLLSNEDGTYYDATAKIEGQEDGGLPEGFDSSHDLAVGDVVGNGYPDIYLGKVLFLNDGKGSFQNRKMDLPEELRPSLANINSSVIGDLNNDGIEDIVTFYGEEHPLNISGYIWLSQDGDSSFKNRKLVELPPGRYGSGTKFNHAVIYDVNQNGLNDIVVATTRDEPYYKGATIQIIINKGDGTFVDQTDAWVDFPEYLESYHGEGQLHVVDVNNNGTLDLVHTLHNVPGIVVYINDGNGLTVMDNDLFPFVEGWQMGEYENSPNSKGLDTGVTHTYPINIDGKNGIDFFSYANVPLTTWPQEEPSEVVLYSIISTRPIPLVHINNALEAELVDHLNTLSDSGWVEESVDEVNRILLDYKEAPVEEWRDVFADYFREFYLTENLLDYLAHQSFADPNPTVRKNLQKGLFYALTGIQEEIISLDNLSDTLQHQPGPGQTLLLTNSYLADLLLAGDEKAAFNTEKIIDHYDRLIESSNGYLQLAATIDPDTHPRLAGIRRQIIANLAVYNYLHDNDPKERIGNIAGTGQLNDPYRQKLWNKQGVFVLDNNVLDGSQTAKIFEVLELFPRKDHQTLLVSANGGHEKHPLNTIGHFGISSATIGSAVTDVIPPDGKPWESDYFTLSVLQGLSANVDSVLGVEQPLFKEVRTKLLESAGKDSLNYLQSQVEPGHFTRYPADFFQAVSGPYFAHSERSLQLAFDRLKDKRHQPADQLLFLARAYASEDDSGWFYMVDKQGNIKRVAIGMDAVGDGNITRLKITDQAQYFFISGEEQHVKAAFGVFVDHVSCHDAKDGKISLVTVGDDEFEVTWEDGSYDLLRDSLGAGIWTLTVQNADLDVEKQVAVAISEPDELLIDFDVITNDLLDLTARVSGGTPPYSYSWDDYIGHNSHTLTEVEYGEYAVEVTDSNGCSAYATVSVEDPSVSVADPAREQQIKVYPNPATDRVYVEIPHDYRYEQILLISQDGLVIRELSHSSNNVREISLEGLSPGVYHIHVRDSHGTVTLPLLKLP